jgi:thiol-disulfide isomerase/thioredoxin
MLRITAIGLFLLLHNALFSQGFAINGTVTGLENQDVLLMRITGDNRKIVDTTQTDITGAFRFELQENVPVGQYGVITGQGQMVELLFNKENIRFVTTGTAATDQVQIIESVENLIYYDYLGIKGTNLYKLDILNPVILYYPKDDPWYGKTLEEIIRLRTQIADKVSGIQEAYPNTMAARFIKVDAPVFADPEMSPADQTLFLKSNYFVDEDFLDTLLLNSNILTSKIVSYLSLYQDKNLNQQQLEEQLIMAVDTVLEKAYVDQTVYEFIIDFMIGGFRAIGFEKGLEHIADHNLLSELCVNTERKAELENKMELIRKLAIGKQAPDFVAPDLLGDTIQLSQVEAEKTVLVFWASWCPHCTQILPELKAFYDTEATHKLQIIGVSLDTEKEALAMAIAENGFNWINIGELKGWDGAIPTEYGIAATPSFFVLDSEKNIIGKPANSRELRQFLE